MANKKHDLSADLAAAMVPIPLKTFFYTTDQIALMLDVSETYLKNKMLFYQGREAMRQDPRLMRCVNIREPDERPEWRVEEGELLRWLRKRKINFTVAGRANPVRPRTIPNPPV